MGFPRVGGVGLASAGSAVVVAALALSFMLAPTAEGRGRKPEDVFKGKIVLANKPYPYRFKNDAQFIRYVKKAKTTEFYPLTEDGSWHFHYMAFFGHPLERRDYSVLFYDITDKSRPRFIMQGGSYPEKAGERIMVGQYDLQRLNFEENKKYLMTYSLGQGQAALAEVVFILRPYDEAKAAALKALRREEERKAKEAEERRAKDKADSKKLEWQPPDW